MSATVFAVYASTLYFAVFGTAFVFRPALVDRFGLQWTNPAGQTEVRAYYGAVSWALAAFLVYLERNGLEVAALTGVLFLATAVLVVRLIGTAIDGAWAEEYTKGALPVEALFVLALGMIRLMV